MALNYAEQYAPEVVEALNQNTLCSPFIADEKNLRWIGAKTFHFTSNQVSGYKNHSRKGGWNNGELLQTDHPFTLEHDRDIQILIDKADVDETNQTASVENVTMSFEKEQAAPETDALFFSKVAATAQKLDGYHTSTAAADYTPETAYKKIKAVIGAGKLRRYKQAGALICFVSSAIMEALEESKDFTRKIEMTQISDGGVGLESRVTSIDGVTVIEVIDDERFYDAFNFASEEGGFVPATGAHKINVLCATPMTTKVVAKINTIYNFAPGEHTEGDGYLYQNRSLSDVFVMPNGKDGKVDSVAVDVDTATYTAAG